MDIITQNKRYLPHEITTKESAVKLYRLTKDISFVCRRYHISKASLMRWNKLYDGTKESLLPNSHKPHTIHPDAHTPEELKWIMDLHRRNPNISVCEMYTKLREKHAYSRHPGSLYRVFVRLGYRKKVESSKKKSKHNGHYDTPTELGIKWQMDVKYVPSACYVGTDGEKFYQYTMIANSACYHDCKWHDEHWFLKGDTPENYAKESERVCSSCTALLSKGKQQSAYIEPEDLRYFDPYVSCYKLVDRYDDTDTIFNTLYSYSARIGSGGKPKEYYNL